MKLVLPGGTGQVGSLLARAYLAQGHDVVVLSRGSTSVARTVAWDAKTLGPWAQELDGADVVINLAGRNVNCRYTQENLALMLNSRVDSTRVVGQAIQAAQKPPGLWLQMSTATIYAHTFDVANDERTGRIGGDEPDAPASWKNSIEIARAWERTQADFSTPQTRQVALRAAVVLSPDRGGIFDVLLGLTRRGLGGPIAGGGQYMSWIHEADFRSAVDFLIEHPELDGPINLASPGPLPQREFMLALRQAAGAPLGLPATAWMAALGAFFLRTETELVLKSRRVVPGRLLEAGFEFQFPSWPEAALDLLKPPSLARLAT